MEILRSNVGFHEIEVHLDVLGSGNRDDNLKRIRPFKNFYLVILSEQEFLELVFLQNPEVMKIAPQGQDRRLDMVASRAIRVGDEDLSKNWNPTSVLKKTMSLYPGEKSFELPSLLIRDTKDSKFLTGDGISRTAVIEPSVTQWSF